ncbi:MAG: hypothetical protein FWG02_03660 [Holophagaceae bacterium]|nr:hypothetical protein [Holophagaceae bacterium]
MNYKVYTLALVLAPLAIIVGCDKKPTQTREEIIAEYEAHKIEQEHYARLEKELADLKDQQAESAEAEQHKLELMKAMQKQVDDQKKKMEATEKAAKELEQTKQATPPPKDEQQTDSPSRERNRPAPITVAKGTQLVVTLSKELTTDSHNTGDSWTGNLAQDVSVGDQVVWTAGTLVSGIVSQSTPTGRLANGEGVLAIKLNDIGGASIDGGIFVVTGDAKGARNAKVIGGTAALGALVGILSDKKNQTDHALGGAAIGAAVGTAVAAGTASTVIKIESAKPVNFEVPADVRIVKPRR